MPNCNNRAMKLSKKMRQPLLASRWPSAAQRGGYLACEAWWLTPARRMGFSGESAGAESELVIEARRAMCAERSADVENAFGVTGIEITVEGCCWSARD